MDLGVGVDGPSPRRWPRRKASSRLHQGKEISIAPQYPPRGEDGRGAGRVTRVKDRYGSPRITRELAREGLRVGHNQVARLIAAHGLGAKPTRCQAARRRAGGRCRNSAG